MSILRRLRHPRRRNGKSDPDPKQMLARIEGQQPEVDRVVAELRKRRQANNFRRQMEEAFKASGGLA